ncbi:MAG: hypothetical protein R6V47_01355 [Candidatus Delongbacteria bacterium]
MTGKKKYIPYLIFLVITIVLFSEFLFTNRVLFSSDQLESGIFFRKFYADFVMKYGEMPLWDRFISCGLPFVDAMHGDTFYPAAVLQFFIPMHKALGLKLVLHVFLSGIFMYIFLKNYGLRKISAFAGSVAYMTAPMIVTLVYPGHDAKMYVAALLPLGFHFLNKGLEGKGYKNFIYFGSVAGLMILSSHIQTTYFALWIYFFFTVYRVVLEYTASKSIKPVSKKFVLFWAGIALMVLIGAVQLLPPYIYSKEFSIRGTEAKTSFEHAISWGIHPEEAFSLIVPEFSGENRMSHVQDIQEQQKMLEEGGNSYWGRNPFKLNSEYSGVIILFLTVLALFLCRGKRRKDIIFFASFGLFTLLYSLVDHTPLFRLAYTIVPGVKLFRGQGMILFILSFVLAAVSALLIDHFIGIREGKKESQPLSKKVLITAVCVLFAGFIGSIALSGLLDLYKNIFDPPKMPSEEYLSVIRNGVLISAFLVSGSLFAVYFYLKRTYNSLVFISIISVLIFADSYRVNRKFIKTVDKDRLGIKFNDIDLTKQIRELEAKDGHFRVFDINMFGTNQLPIHGVSTVRGFHDNELKWFRKFRGINDQGVNTDKNFFDNINNYEENNFINLSGARFLLYKDKDGHGEVMQNSKFMPRAYIVSGYELITGEDNIVSRLRSDFDIRSKVILEKEPSIVRNGNAQVTGKVVSYEYAGNEIELEVSMNSAGIVVMTDNYFPYWHAYDENGEELEILKANLTFRALELSEGDHKITFKYISKPYNTGKYLTLAGLLILLGVILSKFFLKKRS